MLLPQPNLQNPQLQPKSTITTTAAAKIHKTLTQNQPPPLHPKPPNSYEQAQP